MRARTLRLAAILLALAVPSLADTLTTGIANSGNQTSGSAGLISVTIGSAQITGFGGNFSGSSGVIAGNTVTFPWLFCIDALDDITLPSTYNATYTTNGTANGAPVTNAGGIAWLMLNLAPPLSSVDENVGLQLAIWSLVYGNSLSIQSAPSGALAAMSADLAALGSHTAPVDQLLWITPTNSDGSLAQELVAVNTPEPGTIALLATGLLALTTRRTTRHTTR